MAMNLANSILKTYDEMYDPNELIKKFFSTVERLVSVDPGFVKAFEERDQTKHDLQYL